MRAAQIFVCLTLLCATSAQAEELVPEQITGTKGETVVRFGAFSYAPAPKPEKRDKPALSLVWDMLSGRFDRASDRSPPEAAQAEDLGHLLQW